MYHNLRNKGADAYLHPNVTKVMNKYLSPLDEETVARLSKLNAERAARSNMRSGMDGHISDTGSIGGPHEYGPIYGASYQDAIVGKNTFAYGDGNNKYEFQYEVVDLDDLVTSHTSDFKENPSYPDWMQPRSRDRAAYKLQINKIVDAFDPEQLLTDFKTLDRGAPIVNSGQWLTPEVKNPTMVESGNGRVMALRLLKKRNQEAFKAYQTMLREKLAAFGLSSEDLAGKKIPILVRRRTTQLDQKALSGFVEEANRGAGMQMAAVETALRDVVNINDEIVSHFKVPEGQPIDKAIIAPDNDAFLKSFMEKVPDNERAAMVDAKGNLNKVGVARIREALFAYIYKGEVGERLGAYFGESTTPVAANVKKALYDSLGDMAMVEGLVRTGQRAEEYSIVGDIAQVVDKFVWLKKQNMSVSAYLSQLTALPDLTEFQIKLLEFINDYARKDQRNCAGCCITMLKR